MKVYLEQDTLKMILGMMDTKTLLDTAHMAVVRADYRLAEMIEEELASRRLPVHQKAAP